MHLRTTLKNLNHLTLLGICLLAMAASSYLSSCDPKPSFAEEVEVIEIPEPNEPVTLEVLLPYYSPGDNMECSKDLALSLIRGHLGTLSRLRTYVESRCQSLVQLRQEHIRRLKENDPPTPDPAIHGRMLQDGNGKFFLYIPETIEELLRAEYLHYVLEIKTEIDALMDRHDFYCGYRDGAIEKERQRYGELSGLESVAARGFLGGDVDALLNSANEQWKNAQADVERWVEEVRVRERKIFEYLNLDYSSD